MDIFGLEKIDDILSRIGAVPFDIYAEQCSRHRDRTSTCKSCVEVCPTGALKIESSLEVDIVDCIDCGLCATVCPNGVFELKEPSDEKLLSQIRLVLDTTPVLSFACTKYHEIEEEKKILEELEKEEEVQSPMSKVQRDKKAKKRQETGRGKKRDYAIEVPCLGRLNEAFLVAAATFDTSAIWLDSSYCQDCEIEWGYKTASQVAQASQAIINMFGAKTQIFLSEEPPKRIKRKVLKTKVSRILERGEGYSRRGFFGEIRRNLMETGAAVVESSLAPHLEVFKKKNLKNSLEYRIPGKRKLLLESIRELGKSKRAKRSLENKVSLNSLPFAQVRISKDCSVCNWCVLFCPTQALVKTEGKEKDKEGSIDFNLSFCTRCDLCKVVCPTKAVTFSDYFDPHKLLTDEKESLVSFNLYTCTNCRMKFGSTAPSDLCFFCQKKQGLL